MTASAQPLFHADIEQRRAPRHKVRFSARAQSSLRFSFDSLASDGDDITDVTVNDLSIDGMATSDTGQLAIGSIVRLQVPLVGWRDAEVRWLRRGQAGCRFVTPLTQEQLRLAIATSPAVNRSFPGLAEHIWQPPKAEPPAKNIKPVNIISLPQADPFGSESFGDRWTVIFSVSFIAIVMVTMWTILGILSL